MKMIIYGAGKYGKIALGLLEEYGIISDVVGFVDSKKQGEYLGLPIIQIDALDKEIACIIAIGDSKEVVEVQKNLVNRQIENIYCFFPERKKYKHSSFFIDYCMKLEGSILPQVEMHIMDACNLNCRGCAHYSPIFQGKIPDFNVRIRDVKLLKGKFDNILKFYILGGEPFLNPDVDKYVQVIREILPNTDIRIVTNGLLIPKLSQDILKVIKDTDVIIEISEYEPTHRMIAEIKEILNKAEITYIIREFDSKQKFNLPLSLKKNEDVYCISNGCITIWNGKIARCPQLMYMEYFNNYFNTSFPIDCVLEIETCPKGEELKAYLNKEVPLCKYCKKNEVDWTVCGKNPKLSDFVSDYS